MTCHHLNVICFGNFKFSIILSAIHIRFFIFIGYLPSYLHRMNFLSNILREEGGFEYKKAIVDSIVILIRDIPDAKESGLLHLCEFIEDCEFTYLSTQVTFFSDLAKPFLWFYLFLLITLSPLSTLKVINFFCC